jgi:hypothetical protein
MAFQKILTLTLETATAAKMTEYIDLFIRGCQGDPIPMTNLQKEAFVKARFFRILKDIVKSQSDIEKRAAMILEDVETTITNS